MAKRRGVGARGARDAGGAETANPALRPDLPEERKDAAGVEHVEDAGVAELGDGHRTTRRGKGGHEQRAGLVAAGGDVDLPRLRGPGPPGGAATRVQVGDRLPHRRQTCGVHRCATARRVQVPHLDRHRRQVGEVGRVALGQIDAPPGGQVLGDPLLKMDGQAVFKLAVGVLESVARSVLEKAGRTNADIDWLIPHQANIRIMQGTAKKLKLPLDKLVVTVDEHGNTSAASIPLALDDAVRRGQVRRGDTVMLEGVGGGFTWGAVLLDF